MGLRRWFSVDSKTFEIKVEGEGRKEQVIITERRRGRSSWIRFSEEGVRILIKGVESYRRETRKISEGVDWRENGRRYSLESKENMAGRFIQCSVADEDGKRHRLFFPEGDGLVNGWALLVEALQDMGFKVSRGEKRELATFNLPGKTVNMMGDQIRKQPCADTREHGNYQNALWLDISAYILKRDLGFLKDGVVGSWKSRSVTLTKPSEMEAWAKKKWRLKGNMFFYPLNQNLFFMGFDSKEEADWVMENGSRICRGEALILERWTPSTGCTGSKSQNQEVWIRVVGLPLHLWTEEIMVTIGDSCGGFVAMDKDTSLMKNLLWARILVKMKSSGRPTSVNLLAGARSYEIQIWWEIQPRVMEVYPRIFSRETELGNPRVEDEGMIRAAGRVNAERGARRHIPRMAQRELGQWQALHKGGTEGILCQKLKLGGTTREGTISHCGIQKITGERRREEGSTSSNDVLGCTLGFSHGDTVGQSPGMIQIAVGQSPRNETQAVRPNNFSHLEKQKSDLAGKLGETERGPNPNTAKFQNSDASGVGKVVGKLMLSTQNQGRGNEYTATGVELGTGRVSTGDARGDQIGKKESSHHDLGRGLQYGKVTRNALISVEPKSGGKVGDSSGREEGDSVGGDKSRNSVSFRLRVSEGSIARWGRSSKLVRIQVVERVLHRLQSLRRKREKSFRRKEGQ